MALAALAAGMMLTSGAADAVGPDRSSGVPAVRLQLAQGAAELGTAERAAIVQVIRSQLDAFRRDDGAEAFSYASPDIQAKFGNPETFMAMVQSGYRPVYRPQQVDFGELRQVDGRPAQAVEFIGPDGQPVSAIYFMELQPDGTWRIDGVTLIKLPEAAA